MAELVIRDFLYKTNMTVHPKPWYSPDLFSANFFIPQDQLPSGDEEEKCFDGMYKFIEKSGVSYISSF